MNSKLNYLDIFDIEIMIDDLMTSEQEQSNCMFQLSLMLAHIALEPGLEDFKDQATHTLLALVRAKTKKNESSSIAESTVERSSSTGRSQLQRFAAANLILFAKS